MRGTGLVGVRLFSYFKDVAELHRTILIRPKTRFATAAPNDMYSMSGLVGKHAHTEYTHTHTQLRGQVHTTRAHSDTS